MDFYVGSEPKVTRLPQLKPASKVATRFAFASLGMTVEQLRAVGLTSGDIRFFTANGKLVFDGDLDFPEPAPARPRRSPGPHHRPATEVTLRPCMCCGRDFPSEGIHNRLCDRCRSWA